ncbi:hypothetical protein F5X98DRAFT_37753 [Xylaria grammica]|nr:hypothetical protein F5X98DRAFT_37753 [Xylaria grammica]
MHHILAALLAKMFSHRNPFSRGLESISTPPSLRQQLKILNSDAKGPSYLALQKGPSAPAMRSWTRRKPDSILIRREDTGGSLGKRTYFEFGHDLGHAKGNERNSQRPTPSSNHTSVVEDSQGSGSDAVTYPQTIASPGPLDPLGRWHESSDEPWPGLPLPKPLRNSAPRASVIHYQNQVIGSTSTARTTFESVASQISSSDDVIKRFAETIGDVGGPGMVSRSGPETLFRNDHSRPQVTYGAPRGVDESSLHERHESRRKRHLYAARTISEDLSDEKRLHKRRLCAIQDRHLRHNIPNVVQNKMQTKNSAPAPITEMVGLPPPPIPKASVRVNNRATIMLEPTPEWQQFYNQTRREIDRQSKPEPPQIAAMRRRSTDNGPPSDSITPFSLDPTMEEVKSRPSRGRRRGPLNMETRCKTAFKRKFKLSCEYHRVRKTACNCHDFSKLEEGYLMSLAAEALN